MATAPASARNAFRADLLLAQAAARAGVVSSTANRRDKGWANWSEFCSQLQVDPSLTEVDDPVEILMVYAHRVRTGQCSRSGRPVKRDSVDTELRYVGQTLALLGTADPRYDQSTNKLDYRLSSMLRGYKLADPAPSRVKPIPIPVLVRATMETAASTPLMKSCGDMICIALYYLCRPGEYALSSDSALSTPFRFMDVDLYIGQRQLDLATATEAEFNAATYAVLTFTLQKNTVPGEKIGHGRSGHPYFCPVLAVVRRLLHLRQNGAPREAALHSWYTRRNRHDLRVRSVTTLLRKAVAEHGQAFGLKPSDVEARSLRSSGAMALLCARVDTNLIQLVGRWRSDAMFRYLHVQAAPLTSRLAPQMFHFGNFSLAAPLPPAAAAVVATS